MPTNDVGLQFDRKRAGRIVAALFLLQGSLAPVANFALMRRIAGPEGFLANAATHSTQVGLAMLLLLAIGAISVAIAIAFAPIVRPQSRPPTLWLMALSIVALVLAGVESLTLFQMGAVSKAFAASTDTAAFEATRAALAGQRNGAHYLTLLVSGFFLLVFYATTFRHALLPKALALLGLLAVLLHLAAVMPALFGGKVSLNLIAPLGLTQLALIAWLSWRGFSPAPRTRD